MDREEQCDGSSGIDPDTESCNPDCSLRDFVCGDGTREGAEVCDDGNRVAEECPYGVSSCTVCGPECTNITGLNPTYCGDRTLNGTEACDDGNTVTDFCDSGDESCTVCDGTCTMAPGIPFVDCSVDISGSQVLTCNSLVISWSPPSDPRCDVAQVDAYRHGTEGSSETSIPALIQSMINPTQFRQIHDRWVRGPANYHYTLVSRHSSGAAIGAASITVDVPDCTLPDKFNTKVLWIQMSDFTEDLFPEDGRALNTDSLRDMIFQAPDSLNAYLHEASYFEPGLRGTSIGGEVLGPFVLPGRVVDYCSEVWEGGWGYQCDLWGRLWPDVGTTVDPLVDFTDVDRVILVIAGFGPVGFAGGGIGVEGTAGEIRLITVSARNFLNNPLSATAVLSHEFGHTFGLQHAGSWECPDLRFGEDLDLTGEPFAVSNSCPRLRYGDMADVMGGGDAHYSAYHKYVMNFIDRDQYPVAPVGENTYPVEPLETPTDGIKGVEIPLEVDGYFYFIEYRRSLGFDATAMGGRSMLNDKVLIRLRGPMGDNDTLIPRRSPSIEVGSPFVDADRGIQIEVLDITPDYAKVRITR